MDQWRGDPLAPQTFQKIGTGIRNIAIGPLLAGRAPTLDDFEKTGCIFFLGQNAGSNSPRMLHAPQRASERGVPIIAYNPLHERGLERFTNPQSPAEMLTRHQTRIASRYCQMTAGGDLAALAGICKELVEMDGAGAVLDLAGPAPVPVRCAATATCRGSALSASPKSRSWCRWTGWPGGTASTCRAKPA